MPHLSDEIEVVRLSACEQPPGPGQWILVDCSAGHPERKAVTHSAGETYVTTPDHLEMDIYNAVENARRLKLDVEGTHRPEALIKSLPGALYRWQPRPRKIAGR